MDELLADYCGSDPAMRGGAAGAGVLRDGAARCVVAHPEEARARPHRQGARRER